jgi:hypothetical protein
MTTRRYSLAQFAPAIPVRKAEDIFARGTAFDVTRADTFRGRYGVSWRLRCVDTADGALFLLLMQANDVRDDVLGALAAVLDSGDAVAGPFVLSRRPLPDGHSTWELADVPADAGADDGGKGRK